MCRYFAIVLMISCFSAISDSAIAEPPVNGTEAVTLVAVPAETSLYVGDPLLVKAVFQNRRKTAVTLPHPFNAVGNGIHFEVCRPGQTQFERVYALREGECGISTGIEIAANTDIICYEHLFLRNGFESEPIFLTAGKWQLRISTIIGKDVIRSEPTAITIANPAEKIRKALDENKGPVILCLAFNRGVPGDDYKQALEAYESLSGTNSAIAIAQTRVLRELHNAEAAKARQFALDAVKKHRDGLRPVAREYFDLLTAEVLCQRKEYDAAKKLLDGVPERSHMREAILYQLPAELIEKGK